MTSSKSLPWHRCGNPSEDLARLAKAGVTAGRDRHRARGPVTERPIIMNGKGVKAILDGRKTQTRRPIKPQPSGWLTSGREPWNINGDRWGFARKMTVGGVRSAHIDNTIMCPFGQPGALLWVRETFAVHAHNDRIPPKGLANVALREYRDGQKLGSHVRHRTWHRGRWRPSIHMPKWAARLWLRVTDVRVERLQDISVDDVESEGYDTYCCSGFDNGLPTCGCEGRPFMGSEFPNDWDSIYAKRGFGWDANPWVWVIEFEREER